MIAAKLDFQLHVFSVVVYRLQQINQCGFCDGPEGREPEKLSRYCLVMGKYVNGSKFYIVSCKLLVHDRLLLLLLLISLYMCDIFQALLIYSCINLVPPSYGEYRYPGWAIVFGWMVSMCSVLPIPSIAIYKVIRAKGSLYQVRASPLTHWGKRGHFVITDSIITYTR